MLVNLRDEVGRIAGTLSHGQKQWLEIGMLLVLEPRLILLDEPVAGMTDAETDKTADLCLELAGRHSVVVVEHDMEFVAKIAGRQALRNVSLAVPEGSVTVILGRNGMGKTTLLRSLMGLTPVRSGSLRFGGIDIGRLGPHQRARLGIGYVPQGRKNLQIEIVIASLAAQRAMAILLVEQYYDFARSLADKYYVLQRGEMIRSGEGRNMDADGLRELLAVEGLREGFLRKPAARTPLPGTMRSAAVRPSGHGRLPCRRGCARRFRWIARRSGSSVGESASGRGCWLRPSVPAPCSSA